MAKKNKNINKHLDMLGQQVKDKVTGFKGTVTTVGFDLYGCIQVLIHPGLTADNKLDELSWFDVSRIEIDGGRVMDVPNFNYGPIAEGKKGPENKPNMNQS